MPQLTRPNALFMSYGLVSALALLVPLCCGDFHSFIDALYWSSPEYWLTYVLSASHGSWGSIIVPVVGVLGILGIGAKLLFAWLISLLFITDEVGTYQVNPLATASPQSACKQDASA